MNKKILSLVLALVMVLGTFTTVFAEEAKTETEKVKKVVGKDNKIQYVIDKKFVEGYGDGDYGYDKNIKRSEITKLLVFANGNKELAEKLQGSMQLYSDVNAEYWANGVISVGSTVPSQANKLPMLNGYPDGTFKGENDVTYAELAKMLVVLVKTDLTKDMMEEANKNWASQWMTWATQLGILDDVNVTNSNAPANRADAFTMLYNALYKMVEFKRIPTNDKVGVLSSLRNDKLVLNQDAEKQTYTITKDTVFVGTLKTDVNSNIVRVKEINDPDYLLGSLVRIMVNDKNEVSHILELGNPRDLALGMNGGENGTYGRNTRWEGVAKNTIETGVSGAATLKDANSNLFNGYAKLTFSSDKLKVNGLTFHDKRGVQFGPKVDVNSKTKVYVANPFNNQMREVKDINEAMALIGYDQAKWDKVPNVYAGYDEDGHVSSLNNYHSSEVTAKVLVFNVVTKAQGGELLRVVMSSAYNGSATLENTDGKLKDQSFIKNISNFPYNYGSLYDVVELKWAAYNNNYDRIITKIDHDDVKVFPIARFEGFKDNHNLIVKDTHGNESLIHVKDADIFNAKQYKDLKPGDFLQFRTENGNDTTKPVTREISILSILPQDNAVKEKFNKSVAITKFVPGVEENTMSGTIVKVKDSSVEIKVDGDKWEKGVFEKVVEFAADQADLRTLKGYEGRSVVFKFDLNKGYNKPYAYNFRLNDGTNKDLDRAKNLQEVKEMIDQLAQKYGTDASGVTAANVAEVVTKVQKIEEAIKLLPLDDQAKFEANGELQMYGDALRAIKGATTPLVTAELNAEKGKLTAAALGTLKKDNLSAASMKAQIEAKAKSLVDGSKVSVVSVTLTNAPAANADYALGGTVDANIVLQSKTDSTATTITESVTGIAIEA